MGTCWLSKRILFFCLIVLQVRGLRAVSALAQTASSTAKPLATRANYTKEAFVIERYDTRYIFHADGTGEETVTVVVRMQSQAGIQQFGNLSLAYASANQQAEIPYVRVRKPDGSVVSTSLANIQDNPAGVTLQAPLYSDLRVKQLPVTNLAPGDTLEYQLRLVRNHAEIPNEFWMEQKFLNQGIVLEEDVEIYVPRNKYVHVASAKIQPVVHTAGDTTIYEWKTAHLQNEPPDANNKTAATSTKPSIQLTTFENWQQVGDWYRSLQADRITVTPAIQQEAQTLTKGLTTDDAKQQAIYNYVATQFRYIGLAFGIGRYQPHAAAAVLENKFGDCKDKHTVFAALMKAAGYDVWPALINSRAKIDPDVPSPGQVDHVISVLPKGKQYVWLDTTEMVAPFGMLMSPLRDKQALVIPTQGTPELKTTPATPPFQAADTFQMKATLDDKAVLTGRADWSVRGDMELLLRAAFHVTPQADWNKLAQNISYMVGFGGDVSDLEASNPDDTSKPFHMTYSYTRKDYGGSDGKQISPPLPQVMFLLGANDKKPADTIPLGAPGERDYCATTQLPRGDVANLPEDKDIQTDFAEYKETSSVKDGVLVAERSYTIKTPQLPASRWGEYLKFVKAVQDRENLVAVIDAGSATVAATGTQNVPAAYELVTQAYNALLGGLLNQAEDDLRQARAINPKQWGLESTSGDLYLKRSDPDRAIAAYQQELENHPDNLNTGRYLGRVLISNKRPQEAIAVLRNTLKYYPDDVVTNLTLAGALMHEKQYEEAVGLLKKFAAAPNGNANAGILLGQAELDAGQKDAGTADLKRTMETAKAPILANDAAYELVDHGVDLAEARQAAVTALQQMEDATAKITLNDFTNKDLQQVQFIAATWDTIAWADYKLGQYSDAARYEKAAWMLGEAGVDADHLGQIYQKQGKRADAIHMYQLALAAGGLSDVAATQQRLDALQPYSTVSAQKTTVNGHMWATGEELSKLRTTDLPQLPHKRVSAEFFVLVSQRGVEDAQFIQGDESLRTAVGMLKKVNLGMTFPDNGPEKIIRRGILSCSAYTSCQFVVLLPQTVHK